MGELISLATASTFTMPSPLVAEHDVSGFCCGEPDLDTWLRRHALKNETSGASRTFVVTREKVVAGFYSLAVGSVMHVEALKPLRRNMPDPIPVMILGRLAVDQTCANKGLGSGLLKNAVLRTLQVSEMAGLAAMLVHAKHEKAAKFYYDRGFRVSPIQPLTYMLPVKEMAALAGV